jgi:hypothetical protein
MRLILHPGFHKTGTSSLQACLAANRRLLAPYCRIVLQDELTLPLRHATRFCLEQDPLALASFTASFGEACVALAKEKPETVVISCEGLSGRTPGKKNISDYAAAPPLAGAMQDAARAVFGRKLNLTYVYTTRNAEAWLSSAWRHNLWGYRITEDFTTFCQKYAKAADFAGIVGRIGRRVKLATVLTTPLEEVNDAACGPADAVLRLLTLPNDVRSLITNPGIRNTGRSQETSAALLELNRSELDDTELKARKTALLRSAHRE